MNSRSKWVLIVVGLAAVVLLWAVCRRHSAGVAEEGAAKPEAAAEAKHEPASEHEGDKEKAEASRVSRSPTGETIVTLDEETQERIGLSIEPLVAAAHQPTVLAYGTVMEDPASSFTLRAPMTGVLRAPASGTWPRIGEPADAGEMVGYIVPRLTPAEQLDMAARLASARAEVSSAAASLEAARTSYQSKKELRDQGNVVSERAVEEAATKVKSEEARLEAATETVWLIENSLGQQTEAATTKPLVLPRRGQVVETLVQPDEAVESGQPLLRVADLEHLVARVELPAGERIEGRIVSVRVSVIGQEGASLLVEPVGPAPTVGSRTQGQAFLLRLTVSEAPVRPGAAVVAHLDVPGPTVSGVLIPRAAVVRYGGLDWVYVRSGNNQFTRRQVILLSPADGGWFAASGFAAGDAVVTTGAQILLSEELKAQIEREEEAEE